MRHRVLLLCLLLVVTSPASFAHSQTIVTQLTDPTGDDYGPGTYTYPTDATFVPGVFDLTEFTVIKDGVNVHFDLVVSGPITNPWGSTSGFSVQSIDIYIDQDGVDGSGQVFTVEGRNVMIASRDAWERLVWVAPAFDDFLPLVIFPDGSYDFSGVTASVDTATHTIRLTAPVSLVGDPQPGWTYIVAMLGQDGYAPGRVRAVNALPSQWAFGGGDDGWYDSNIIDLVLAPGLSQEGMLSAYDPDAGIFPILYGTADGVPPVITHTPIPVGEEHRPIVFSATITDDLIADAYVRYRIDGGAFTTLSLDRQGVDQFEAIIPGVDVAPGLVEYFLVATDGPDTSSAPADTSAPYAFTVGPDVTPPLPFDLLAVPDPFSPNGDHIADETTLSFSLPEPATVDVTVLDPGMRPIRSLATDWVLSEGDTTIDWDGRDSAGVVQGDGLYHLRVDATDLADLEASAETSVTIDMGAEPRQLDVLFLFHFNQNLVPYSRVGNAACYVGLLQTLRNHPQSKFLIHFSGPLTQSLLWFDPTAIELIREGVADEQFEIVGSTYIQNVMYSTRSDSLDFQQNQAQITAHLELIDEVFGVRPVSFWNAERVWTQNFTQLLVDNGYQNVQIEDHILERAGITGSEHRVRTTTYNGRTINVFNDDKGFLGAADYAINTGNNNAPLGLLGTLYDEDVLDEYAVTYAQDAEATGLWQYENGTDPAINWANLDALLTAIESDGRFRITTYSEWLESHTPAEDVSPIPDGAADWMGRDAWFADNAHPDVEAHRQLYDTVRDSLNATAALLAAATTDTTAAGALLHQGWRTFSAHQYEFGVLGSPTHGSQTDWEKVRSALVFARAARHALGGPPLAYQADINDDPDLEVVLTIGTDMAVLSPKGGRLLYWFDLEKGVQLTGPQNFFHYGESYVTDSHWRPVLQGGSDVYSWLSGNPVLPEVFTWSFEIRRRALADHIEIDTVDQGDLRNSSYTVAMNGLQVVFSKVLTGDVTLYKTVELVAPGSIWINYRFEGADEAVKLRVENCLSPHTLSVMDHGRQSLAYWDGDTTSVFHPGVTGVVNLLTDDRVEVLPSDFGIGGITMGKSNLQASYMTVTGWESRDVVFGIHVDPTFEGTLAPGEDLVAALHLRRELDLTGAEPPPAITPAPSRLQLYQNQPNPFSAQTSLRFDLPSRGSEETYELAVYDVRGRRIRILEAGSWRGEGQRREINWDGRDSHGTLTAPGVYLVRLRAGALEHSIRMVRLR
jgi:hypothetical protein